MFVRAMSIIQELRLDSVGAISRRKVIHLETGAILTRCVGYACLDCEEKEVSTSQLERCNMVRLSVGYLAMLRDKYPFGRGIVSCTGHPPIPTKMIGWAATVAIFYTVLFLAERRKV